MVARKYPKNQTNNIKSGFVIIAKKKRNILMKAGHIFFVCLCLCKKNKYFKNSETKNSGFEEEKLLFFSFQNIIKDLAATKKKRKYDKKEKGGNEYPCV
jgi:hypothetical protein